MTRDCKLHIKLVLILYCEPKMSLTLLQVLLSQDGGYKEGTISIVAGHKKNAKAASSSVVM